MKEEFYNQSFEKLKSAITNIDKSEIENIYALSFWFYNEDDELHFPTIILSYNTKSNFQKNIENASDENEAKWNFAYWLQNELEQIGGEDDKVLEKWFEKSKYYYSEEENELAEDDDDLFDKLCAKGEKFNKEFIELVVKMSSELHKNGIVKEIFGKSIPIIIHELEYYDKPVNWTKKGNPIETVKEFIDWVETM
ncbi:MAG TPA: hypothetical protein DDZ39_01665 [Flavobacteriaceae bacterium]|jgi:hypothetical protein|nr:hypothetical protein [Flavobacteriaceae bacterium]HBS12934.1 hypothetical protein [Flavobacteriaceae bacterium]